MTDPASPPATPATIDMVARQAGVSIATVSRVLNRSVAVAPETAERVRAAVAALGYTPQTAAKNLAKGKTNAIGLLLPDISADFFWPLLRGITLTATKANYSILLGIRSSEEQDTPDLAVGRHNTDGLIVFERSVDDDELRQFEQLGIPVVLLYRSAPAGTSIPSIVIENKRGAQQIVSHLIEAHGRRRIAFLAAPEGNQDGDWRERGYREALHTHGIAFDAALVGAGGFSEHTARDTVAGWLRDGLDFDAVFASDDDAARGALAALTVAGRHVPDDVSVAGFDDSPLSDAVSAPLTTVRAPTVLVGQTAVEHLLARIANQPVALETLLPTELVIRRSCGCG